VSGDPRARWDALEGDVDALLELPAAAREARLAAIGNDDPARADALRDWLAAIDASAGLLDAPAPKPPQGTGPWRPVARIGEGGMGEVWRGERADGAFERTVAIKFLRGDRTSVAASIARERALLARLRHPGIAQLLDGGVADDGRPWLVMEWVDGRRLDQWLEQAHPPLRTRIDLLLRLAGAVAYAHANLVVHRDLKPANVMVDAAGEPRLLDFGIARLLDDGAATAATVDQALTPAWAAPEQLRGEPVDARADVHGLGALLFYVLTARTPHGLDGRSLAAVVDAVCHEDPPPPSRVAPSAGIDADLDAITLKALARDPQQRYASADAFAADLARWLEGRDVAARLPTRLERLRRGVRRHPLEAALGAGLLLALGGGIAATTWQALKAEAARREALAERDAALAEATRGEYLVDAFARLFREGDTEERLTASEWLDRAAALGADAGPENDDAHARYLVRLAAIEQDRGQNARAAALLRRALAAPEPGLPVADRAHAECRLGSALNMAGDGAGAAAAFDAGTARAEALRGAERITLVDCLVARANAALVNGAATPAAMRAAQRALEVLDALTGAGDLRWRRAGVLYALAALHDLNGEDAEAARRYEDVMAIDQALGNTRSTDHAALLTAMAGSLQRAGDWDGADRRFAEGIAIYEAIGTRNPNLASDLANHAALRNLRGDAAGALAAADRALAILDQLDGANPVAIANAHLARGVALRELGRFDEAAVALADAEAGYRASHPDVARPARAVVERALNELGRGRPDAARDLLAPVLALAREPGRGALLAQALQAQARIAAATGDREAARAASAEAADLLAARLPPQHPLRRRAESLAADFAAAAAPDADEGAKPESSDG
jgi:tetratricopeptide (TPR) repeat protein